MLLVFTLHGTTSSGGDRWFGADKAKHFFMAAFVESAAFSGLRLTGMRPHAALNTAVGLTGGLSVGKEVYDRFSGGDPSFKDLTWDGAGMAAAAVLLHQTKP